MCRHFLCVTKFYSWMKRVQNVGAIGELCKLRCLDAIRMLSVVLGRAGRVWIRLVWVNAHWWSHMESKLVNDHVSLGALGIFWVKNIYIYLSIYLSLSTCTESHWNFGGGFLTAAEVFQDLLWSDPQEKLGWEANPRGAGIKCLGAPWEERRSADDGCDECLLNDHVWWGENAETCW